VFGRFFGLIAQNIQLGWDDDGVLLFCISRDNYFVMVLLAVAVVVPIIMVMIVMMAVAVAIIMVVVVMMEVAVAMTWLVRAVVLHG
jgi:hypothetical protein